MSQSRRLRQKNENTFCRPPDFHYLCMTKQTIAMRIHHFNPEHEICLASGRSNYTPPHAATRLRSGLGWMPALWAEKGDIVLVAGKGHEKYQEVNGVRSHFDDVEEVGKALNS